MKNTTVAKERSSDRPDDGLFHLSGAGSEIRQVIAAHFIKRFDHILEIGGHDYPITNYITHQPKSVLSVDPKTAPYETNTLNGAPCSVHHVAKKFQQLEYNYTPLSYALVMIGYSLKPFGRADPLGELLFGLIDNAGLVVVDYAPALLRASSQMSHIVERESLQTVCSMDLNIRDHAIETTPYAKRRLIVLRPR